MARGSEQQHRDPTSLHAPPARIRCAPCLPAAASGAMSLAPCCPFAPPCPRAMDGGRHRSSFLRSFTQSRAAGAHTHWRGGSHLHRDRSPPLLHYARSAHPSTGRDGAGSASADRAAAALRSQRVSVRGRLIAIARVCSARTVATICDAARTSTADGIAVASGTGTAAAIGLGRCSCSSRRQTRARRQAQY